MSQGDRVFYKMLKVLFIVMILRGFHTFLILRNEKIDREFFYVAGYCEVPIVWNEAFGFMAACVLTLDLTQFSPLLSFEPLMSAYMSKHGTRIEDSTSGLWYDCSANFLWIGEQTHQLDP
jgi:3-deoxy-D-arabino-heptulosonate 7-phosphate (DAHP) synthase class II